MSLRPRELTDVELTSRLRRLARHPTSHLAPDRAAILNEAAYRLDLRRLQVAHGTVVYPEGDPPVVVVREHAQN